MQAIRARVLFKPFCRLPNSFDYTRHDIVAPARRKRNLSAVIIECSEAEAELGYLLVESPHPFQERDQATRSEIRVGRQPAQELTKRVNGMINMNTSANCSRYVASRRDNGDR